jgi:hypothetical protein
MVNKVEAGHNLFPKLFRGKQEQQRVTEDPISSLYNLVLRDGRLDYRPSKQFALGERVKLVVFKHIEIEAGDAKKLILEVALGKNGRQEGRNIAIRELIRNGIVRCMKFEKNNFSEPSYAMEYEVASGRETVGKSMSEERQGDFMKEILRLLQNQRASSAQHK